MFRKDEFSGVSMWISSISWLVWMLNDQNVINFLILTSAGEDED